MAMRMRKMRIHADDAHIYKANKRIYADADAMRMMRIAKNCRMAIPSFSTFLKFLHFGEWVVGKIFKSVQK